MKDIFIVLITAWIIRRSVNYGTSRYHTS